MLDHGSRTDGRSLVTSSCVVDVRPWTRSLQMPCLQHCHWGEYDPTFQLTQATILIDAAGVDQEESVTPIVDGRTDAAGLRLSH